MAERKPAAIAPAIPTRKQWDDWIAANPDQANANQLCQEDFEEWRETAIALKWYKDKEAELRRKVAAFYFPNPSKGTNNLILPDGNILNLQYKINITVDEATLTQLMTKDESGKSLFEKNNIVPDKVFKWKPSVVSAGFNMLSEEQQKIVSAALIGKPSDTPALTYKVEGEPDAADE